MSRIQNYISSELTHFVGRRLLNDDERYNLLVDIIKTGIIRTRNNNGRGAIIVNCDRSNDISSNDAFNPDMVCFCDIPIADFKIHMDKYSHFGLSFSKEFMISQGMRPVYYIPRNTIVSKRNISDIFNDSIKKFSLLGEDLAFYTDFFFDYHIFSFIKFFDSEKDDNDPDNYYMEREWRGLERIEFNVHDITRIILPSNYIKRFFEDIPEYNSHISTT